MPGKAWLTGIDQKTPAFCCRIAGVMTEEFPAALFPCREPPPRLLNLDGERNIYAQP